MFLSVFILLLFSQTTFILIRLCVYFRVTVSAFSLVIPAQHGTACYCSFKRGVVQIRGVPNSGFRLFGRIQIVL